MSRARLSYVLAACGILITTGGCADSATAPEAMTTGPALNRAKGDSIAAASRPADDGVTTLSSGFMTSGGRSDVQSP